MESPMISTCDCCAARPKTPRRMPMRNRITLLHHTRMVNGGHISQMVVRVFINHCVVIFDGTRLARDKNVRDAEDTEWVVADPGDEQTGANSGKQNRLSW